MINKVFENLTSLPTGEEGINPVRRGFSISELVHSTYNLKIIHALLSLPYRIFHIKNVDSSQKSSWQKKSGRSCPKIFAIRNSDVFPSFKNVIQCKHDDDKDQ